MLLLLSVLLRQQLIIRKKKFLSVCYTAPCHIQIRIAFVIALVIMGKPLVNWDTGHTLKGD